MILNVNKEYKAYAKKVDNLRTAFVNKITKQVKDNEARRASIESTRIELEVEDARLEGMNNQLKDVIKEVKGETK